MVGLECPCCRSPMEEHQRDGVSGRPTTVDVCTGCGGLWLDAGELEALVGACPPAQGLFPQYRKCPHCLAAMNRVAVGPVAVERCATCAGYFFDPGELEQLLGSKPAPRFASDAEAPATFTCQKCSGNFPWEQGYAVPNGRLCDPCSGFVSPRSDSVPGPLGRFLTRLVESLPADPRAYLDGKFRRA